MTENLNISEIISQQRQFFATGQTKQVDFRLSQLRRLQQAIADFEQPILEAVKADLGRPELEGLFELSTLGEIKYALKNLKSWVKPRRVKTHPTAFPASSYIYPEPLGVVLIIGPWNYPFQLVISPLVGAIAAGNCAILKPSELAVHTSQVVADLISKTFSPNYIATVQGGVEVSQQLLDEPFDHIFFTGGKRIGKIVMTAAAKHLTPVTLELGGKSPCIVDADTQLDYTAKRIVWGKFINAGQTCIAPDYLLVDRRIKSDLITAMIGCIESFYGSEPQQSPDYGRIINHYHFHRLTELIHDGKIVAGGKFDESDRYISPTLIDEVSWEDPIMQDEIFGPILPILTYNDLGDAISQINARPKPLALYLFSRNKQSQQRVLQETSSGGICFNETIMQVGGQSLPFGGVGESGIGKYHGQATFDTFCHYKSLLKQSLLFDIPLRYAPYKPKFNLMRFSIKNG
ncbi:MAG: aldehyde dehydrogenase [Limnospira sp. PMC 1291.21]|uniref:aldehyde dehydrogenase n=1 Tax=unclassified Limnospira TaxID=2642885 RepID=UPI0028E18205|nr:MULTISPECIES: aldehyde dehydrogenase [unclassified Limnospira]MDT9176159.1 aldehyde dehydrogenase [Limnospira sp. PMC 1238.20]MDT9191479.1 aldehyde dehydrogenase [Limnospira sp. PMC 1245.20]MDT9201611.1 aldehyde dehydrogenase [Limnospira sp. PMC 1243.20]MDT9206857.1 aldehyde dehydrogenase [Limnospira sp. PMC 1252.20]MDT9212042.1 aldehyde dehydrogenase [Limnospira sp. PMC 1256.20]